MWRCISTPGLLRRRLASRRHDPVLEFASVTLLLPLMMMISRLLLLLPLLLLRLLLL